MPSYDMEALVRAVLIGIGVGCVTGMIGYFVMKADWPRRIPVLIMGGCGIGLLAAVAAYYALPARSNVPVLDNLSQTEAQDLLTEYKLIPSARPQYAQGVPAGRVIPQSQSPGAGLLVAHGSVVSFGVSQQSTAEVSRSRAAPAFGGSDLQLFEPKDRGILKCSRGVGGITRCSVSGITGDMLSGARLLLWLQPVDPPSETPGWYLQRPPANGIKRIENDGTWNGTVQIGDAQYPANEGNQVDVGVGVLGSDEAKRLLSETGVVVRDQPQGTTVRTASRVVVTFK